MTALSKSRISTLRRNLLKWYHVHKRDLPWRRHPKPYPVTVSEFMLQQTQVATALPYFRRWMKQFPTWKKLARAPESQVLKAWEGLGYYNRVRNLHRLAQTVTDEFHGRLPHNPDQLQALPGIGPYTAGAIASIAFDRRQPLVDGNVERVYSRLFNWNEDIKAPGSQKQLWSWAEQLTPTQSPGDYNQAIMELGALICTPRQPQCLICPLRRQCRAPDPEKLPRRQRTSITRQSIDYALLTRNHRIWLVTPGNAGRWKSLHRLPEFDVTTMKKGTLLHSFTFGITRYQVSARLVQARWKSKPPSHGRWFPLKELDHLSLPSPHRKALNGAKVGK
jgi:A/G-specific adenine glycosylase